MSRLFLRIPLVLLFLSSFAYGQQPRPLLEAEAADPPALKLVAEMKSDLRDARQALQDLPDRKLRQRLELYLSRAALHADDLQQLLQRQRPAPSARAISAEDFARLLKGLKAESFDNDKLEFVVTFVKQRPLSSAQAIEILKTFSFDQGRVKAAIALHPVLVDPENFFEVLKVFTFETSRKQVQEGLRGK